MRYWIFQSNPTKFDLHGALQEAPAYNDILVFRTRQHVSEVAPGDRVYLYSGGARRKQPGVHAIATVMSYPACVAPEVWQQRYGVNLAGGGGKEDTILRVRLKVERYLEVPVPRDEIYGLREMERHVLVTSHQGTNLLLSLEQARAIDRLIESPRSMMSTG